MNGNNFTIGVLSVTAAILLAALAIVQSLPSQPALAGQGGAAGNYLVTTSRLNDTTELLVIVDTTSQRMNVYGLNARAGQLTLIQQLDVRARPGRATPG